jgi:hypothetical protein
MVEVLKRTVVETKALVQRDSPEQLWPSSDAAALDACMVLIIDELGTDAHKSFISNSSQLNQLRDGLCGTIATEVCLVLAGTGLDAITSDINSKPESVKVRMKAWGFEEIDFLFQAVYGKNILVKEIVCQTIRNHPILAKLVTTHDFGEFYNEQCGLVDVIVKTAALKYCLANALRSCGAEQRRRVTKLVFENLARAKKGKFVTLILHMWMMMKSRGLVCRLSIHILRAVVWLMGNSMQCR